MSEVEFKAEDGWEEMPDFKNDTWCPKKKGDQLRGIYTNKRMNVGVNRANLYTIKNSDGEWVVFGTEALNNKLKNVPIGYEVGIIYMGEKPSKPPKKPFKMFRVFRRAPKNLKKPETKKEEQKPSPKEQETKPEKEENKAAGMNLSDDSDTWGLIEMISTDLAAEHKHVNDKEILKRAIQMSKDSAQDFTEKELKDVERVLNQGLLK
mgnify:FL=1|jgi:hypothetical protein